MSWTEIAGFSTGALCVWLIVKQKIWNFPVGIANNVFFIVLFAGAGLYADAGLQLVYIGLALMGWYWWLHGGADRGRMVVRHTPRSAWLAIVLGIAVATPALSWVLSTWTNSTVAGWDALTTVMSLGATLMLNRKWLGNWMVWIAADVIYIALYAGKGLWLTSVLYGIFLLMCLVGLRDWQASLRAVDAVEVRGAAERLTDQPAMTAKEFDHGLVLGKFYPLHAGHSALISEATRRCRRVTVQVLASLVESIPLEDRARWVREAHPGVHLVAAMDEADMDVDSPAAWDEHMAIISSHLDEPVDAVFTSDPYGAELASRLQARWVQVDPGRMSIPVSGTGIRADVPGHWWALGGGARSWFTRRVVVVGAESTGTTTLARELARHYRTSWVPEYGREWSQIRPGGLSAAWESSEFDLIAREQARLEDDAARVVPCPLLICDTDALATSLWHERYVGQRSVQVEAMARSRKPDLYLLTDCDIPFVQDGLRDGELMRQSMTERFREALSGQPAPWVVISGSRQGRLEMAIAAVDKVTEHGWDLADPLG